MEVIGEFIIEIFIEIIGGLFIGVSKSRYVPKWLRIIAITIMTGVFGGILLLIAFAVFGPGNLMIVLGIIIAVIWLGLVIRTLTLKTKKYEYVSLDENNSFKGKHILGQIIGSLTPKNISHGLDENKEIKVSFSRTVQFPQKEQNAVIEEQETKLLKELYNMSDDKLDEIINRARNELMKKSGNMDNGYSNGKSIILKKISYVKSPDEYVIYYYFKDEKSGKNIKINEKKALV